jgi:hypothetical protein
MLFGYMYLKKLTHEYRKDTEKNQRSFALIFRTALRPPGEAIVAAAAA